MEDMEEGRILEVREPRTGTLLGVCSGVREEGDALRVAHMILCGSSKPLGVPDFTTKDSRYWEFDLRNGNRLCYGGCTWYFCDQTFSNGETLVVCEGIVNYKERGRGATHEDGT